MVRLHNYTISLKWTGNTGAGTSDYKSYSRDHLISGPGKPEIQGSSDPAFRGDATRYNPEELLLASLSSCHMLWFLHLCAEAGIVVVDYVDNPAGIMEETAEGGAFKEVTLKPVVTVRKADEAVLSQLHHAANAKCFIANSMNFPVKHAASFIESSDSL